MDTPSKKVKSIQDAKYIKAYHKGFHEVIKIYENTGPGPAAMLVEYKQVFNEEGRPFKGKTYCCHIDFCRPVTNTLLNDLIEEQQSIISNFQALKKKL